MSYKGFTFSGFTSKLNGFQWSKPIVEEPVEKLEHPKEYKVLLEKLHILKSVQSNLIKITQTTFPGCKRTLDINTMRDTLNNLSQSLTNGFNYSPTKDEHGKHEKKGSVGSNSSLLNPSKNHSKNNSVSQETTTPYHTMALAFVDCGLDIGVEETLGAALYKVATIQQKIGDAFITMESVLATNFIEPLMLNVDTNIKFIEKTCNQVDQGLQILNSIKNRYDLAGENANEELKSEFIAAQDNYNNSIDQAKTLIHNVIESPETIKRLLELISSQMEYHKEAYQLLSDILPQLNDMVATESILKKDNSSDENHIILPTNNVNREPSIISSNSLEPSQPEILIIEPSFNNNSAPYFNPFSKATTSTDAIHTVAHDSSEEHINSEIVNENLNTRDIYLPDILKSSNNSMDEELDSEPDFAYSDHSNINNEVQQNLLQNIYKNEIQSAPNEMETPDLTVDYDKSISQDHSSLNNNHSIMAESSNLQDMELPNNNLNANDVILNEVSLPETYNNDNVLEVPREFVESSTLYDSIIIEQETNLNDNENPILEDNDLNKEITIPTAINDQVNQNEEDNNLNNNEFEFIPTPLDKIDEITEDEESNLIINHLDFENEQDLEDEIINDKQVILEGEVLNVDTEKVIDENKMSLNQNGLLDQVINESENTLKDQLLNQVTKNTINDEVSSIQGKVSDKSTEDEQELKDKLSNEIIEKDINEVEVNLKQDELSNTINEDQSVQTINRAIEHEQDQVVENIIDSSKVIENGLDESNVLTDVVEKVINENNEDLKGEVLNQVVEKAIDEAKQDLNQQVLNVVTKKVINDNEVALNEEEEVKHIINQSELNLDGKVLNQVIEEVLNEDEVTLKRDQVENDTIEKSIDQSEQDKALNDVIEDALNQEEVLNDITEKAIDNEIELEQDKVLNDNQVDLDQDKVLDQVIEDALNEKAGLKDFVEDTLNESEVALNQDEVIHDIIEKDIINKIELEDKLLNDIINEVADLNQEKDIKEEEDLTDALPKDIQPTYNFTLNEEEVKDEISDNNTFSLDNSAIENDSLSSSMFNNILNDNNKLEEEIISIRSNLIKDTHVNKDVESNFIIKHEESDLGIPINEHADNLQTNLDSLKREIDNEDENNLLIKQDEFNDITNKVSEEHLDLKEELNELKSDIEKVIESKENLNEIQVDELQSINNIINHIVDKELLSKDSLVLDDQDEHVLSKEIVLDNEGSFNDVVKQDITIEEIAPLQDSVGHNENEMNELNNVIDIKEQLNSFDEGNDDELEQVIAPVINESLGQLIEKEKDNIDIEKEISNVLGLAEEQGKNTISIENEESNIAENEINELLDQVIEKEKDDIDVEKEVKDIAVENEINELLDQVIEEETNRTNIEEKDNTNIEEEVIDTVNENETEDLVEQTIKEQANDIDIKNEELLEQATEEEKVDIDVEKEVNDIANESDINDLLEQVIEEEKDNVNIEKEINNVLELAIQQETNKVDSKEQNDNVYIEKVVKDSDIENDINDLLEQAIKEEKDNINIENEINDLLEEAIERQVNDINTEEKVNDVNIENETNTLLEHVIEEEKEDINIENDKQSDIVIESEINDLLEQDIEEKTNKFDIEDKNSIVNLNNINEINEVQNILDLEIQKELDSELKLDVQNAIKPLDILKEEDEIINEAIEDSTTQLDLVKDDIINKEIEIDSNLEDEPELINNGLEDAGINSENELPLKLEENSHESEIKETNEEFNNLNHLNDISNLADELSKQPIENIKQKLLDDNIVESTLKEGLEIEDPNQTINDESKDVVLSTLNSLDFNSDFNLNTGLLNVLNQHELQSSSDINGIEEDNDDELDLEMDLTTEAVNQEQQTLIAKISNSDNELNNLSQKGNVRKKSISFSTGIENNNSFKSNSSNSIKQFNLKSHKKSNSVLNKVANFEKEIISSSAPKVNGKLKNPGLKTSLSERLSKFEKS